MLGFSQNFFAWSRNKVSSSETIDSGSIPSLAKPKTKKFAFTASLLDVHLEKGQCEASALCGRH